MLENVINYESQSRGDDEMIKTIVMSTHVSVQGIFVKGLPDGRVLVRDGDKVFLGYPVSKSAC